MVLIVLAYITPLLSTRDPVDEVEKTESKSQLLKIVSDDDIVDAVSDKPVFVNLQSYIARRPELEHVNIPIPVVAKFPLQLLILIPEVALEDE